jgi:acetoin utilization deacetylase AcuC-like enzyme
VTARFAVFSHPDGLRHEAGPGHPERPARIEAVLEGVRAATADLDGLIERRGRHATEEELALVHPPGHIERIRAASERALERGYVYLDGDTAVNAASYDAARAAAGCALDAVDAVAGAEVAHAFCAVRPPGHHATKDRAMGFCLFNNVAIAVRYAQQRWDLPRAVVIDWDLHHGNGTQEIFYEDADVTYVSIHQSPLYPGTGSASERGRGKGLGTTRNLPQPPGLPPKSYADALHRAIDEVAAGFRPDLIFISAGFDAAAGDPLGGLTLRPLDYYDWTVRLVAWASSTCQDRVVSVLEGGYDLGNLRRCAGAHAAALAGAPPANDPHEGATRK